MFILKFLFIIFLVGLLIVLFVVFGLLNVVSKARKQFKEQGDRPKNINGSSVSSASPDGPRRKIIPDDEGEYVEYEEVKE